MFNDIVLHVPHSSADFSLLGASYGSACAQRWREMAKDLIDWYTDELFVPEHPESGIHTLVFKTCRTVCDVERMSHDPLEEKGCGITSSALLPLCRGYKVSSNDSILQTYLDHQYELASILIRHGGSLLLDCHSFSCNPTPLIPDTTAAREIDVCIGFNEDFTKPDDSIITTVCGYFRDCGYRVAVNSPFSNSKTVDTPARYSSLMIELNKSLYMDEGTLEKKMPAFLELQGQIRRLYMKLSYPR